MRGAFLRGWESELSNAENPQGLGPLRGNPKSYYRGVVLGVSWRFIDLRKFSNNFRSMEHALNASSNSYKLINEIYSII